MTVENIAAIGRRVVAMKPRADHQVTIHLRKDNNTREGKKTRSGKKKKERETNNTKQEEENRVGGKLGGSF